MISPFDTFVDFAQLLLRLLCTFLPGMCLARLSVHFKTDRMQRQPDGTMPRPAARMPRPQRARDTAANEPREAVRLLRCGTARGWLKNKLADY
jgi:hypothetical protein